MQLFTEIPALPDGDDDDDGPIVGYYQKYGVTAATEGEACDLVTALIEDGEIDWSDSVIWEDVVGRLDERIFMRAGDWTQTGIWYKSGRAFFPRE